MKRSDLIIAIFWLVFGLLVCIGSTRYQIGRLTRPGPGLFPLGLGVLLILLSFGLLLKSFKLVPKHSVGQDKGTPFFRPGQWKKVAYNLFLMVFGIVLFETIGSLATIFLLVFLLMLGADPRSWVRILLTALLTALGVYVIFVLLLEQQLPTGFLGI